MGLWKYYYIILVIIWIYLFYIHAPLNQIIVVGVAMVIGLIAYLLIRPRNRGEGRRRAKRVN